MNDGVKEYELRVGFVSGVVEPCIRLMQLRDTCEEWRFPSMNREAAWTQLRDMLRTRGECILGIIPDKAPWSGEDRLILLTEPIAEASVQEALRIAREALEKAEAAHFRMDPL